MNSLWYKIALLGFLLMFLFAPYAGFAPLLLVLFIASIYWFLTSIVKVLVFGDRSEVDRPQEQ